MVHLWRNVLAPSYFLSKVYFLKSIARRMCLLPFVLLAIPIDISLDVVEAVRPIALVHGRKSYGG